MSVGLLYKHYMCLGMLEAKLDETRVERGQVCAKVGLDTGVSWAGRVRAWSEAKLNETLVERGQVGRAGMASTA